MLRPVNDNILVEPLKAGERTPGGVLIPEASRDRFAGLRALVVEVGPGAWTIQGARLVMSCKAGDVVLLSRGGLIIDEGGRRYAVVQDRDVLAVVEPAAAPEANGLSPAGLER